MEEYIPEEVASFLGSALEKVAEKLPGRGSSSSDSNDEKSKKPEPSLISALEKRLFGCKKHVQRLFGGIKFAVGMLWRNKQTLAGVLAGAIFLWFLSERLRYYLLAHIYHALILGIRILFICSKISAFLNKQPVRIPRISFSKLFQDVASAVIFAINRLFVFAVIHDDACGRYLKKFLMVVACLWFLSVAYSRADFLTLFYVVLHVFRKITKAVISSPGFDDSVNNLCGYILDRATASIPELEAAMFMPGARRLVLNVLKMQAKQGLILLLVGSGENYNDAKAFVGLYVTDTV